MLFNTLLGLTIILLIINIICLYILRNKVNLFENNSIYIYEELKGNIEAIQTKHAYHSLIKLQDRIEYLEHDCGNFDLQIQELKNQTNDILQKLNLHFNENNGD